MPKITDAIDRLGDEVARALAARPSDDGVGAAIIAAALVAQRASDELASRDRVIRIARREGASLRALADATGLSHGTVANICSRKRH